MNHDDKKYFEELFIRHGEELFAKQREEFQHFVSVIIKDSDRKFALLSEGHRTLSEKIDGIGHFTQCAANATEEIERLVRQIKAA